MEPSPSAAARPAAPRARPRWPHVALAVGLLFYAWLLARQMRACAGGSDSSGYLNSARMLAEGRAAMPMRLLPGLDPATLPAYTHVPLGFVPDADLATMRPTYPVGLPLLAAAASRLASWDAAPGWVMGFHALAGLGLVYLLARRAGLGAEWALLGALMLAASPLYLFFALQFMSDVPALVWVTAAIYLAWCSRERPGLAAAAGGAFALAVLVRPTNLLAAAPLAIALGCSWPRWGLAALGGLPGAAFLAAYNVAAYGRILTTGYGSVADQFSWAVVPATLAHYAVWLPALLSPFIVLAVALSVPRGERRWPTVLLAAWALLFLAFYLFDIHTHEFWWYLRFVLPAAPALIVAALRRAAALVRPLRPWAVRCCLAAAAAAVVVNGLAWSRHLYLTAVVDEELTYPQTAAWLREHVPANAVIASMQTSGTLLYYTRFTFFRWDMIGRSEFERIERACAAQGRPIYAALFAYEIDAPDQGAFARHLPGRWVRVGAARQTTFWRYAAPAAP